MGSLMLQEMGISMVEGLADYAISREEAKIQAIMTKHHNTMTAITASISHNQLNRNSAIADRQNTMDKISDQVVSMQDKEAARVSARAAGAYGNSADAVLSGIDRAAAQKSYARKLAHDGAKSSINDQRREIEMNRVSNTKVDVIPKGSGLLSAMSIGMSLLDIYNKHNPGPDNPNQR